MRLYVCYGTFTHHDHSCGRAYEALKAAGHEPDVTRVFGCYGTDPIFPGRRRVKRMTGSYKVPVLELDDGTLITDSRRIAAWAESHPS